MRFDKHLVARAAQLLDADRQHSYAVFVAFDFAGDADEHCYKRCSGFDRMVAFTFLAAAGKTHNSASMSAFSLRTNFQPFAIAFSALWVVISPLSANDVIETDICVYGGTSGGVIAAVAAAREGKRAL